MIQQNEDLRRRHKKVERKNKNLRTVLQTMIHEQNEIKKSIHKIRGNTQKIGNIMLEESLYIE